MTSKMAHPKQKIILLITAIISGIILLYSRDLLYAVDKSLYFAAITPIMLFGALNAIAAALILSMTLNTITQSKKGIQKTIYTIATVLYGIIAALGLTIYILVALFSAGCPPGAMSC